MGGCCFLWGGVGVGDGPFLKLKTTDLWSYAQHSSSSPACFVTIISYWIQSGKRLKLSLGVLIIKTTQLLYTKDLTLCYWKTCLLYNPLLISPNIDPENGVKVIHPGNRARVQRIIWKISQGCNVLLFLVCGDISGWLVGVTITCSYLTLHLLVAGNHCDLCIQHQQRFIYGSNSLPLNVHVHNFSQTSIVC